MTTQENVNEIIGKIIGVLFICLIVWFMFGGIFENNESNTVTIDCTGPNSKYNQYCNGEYADSVNMENYLEDSYYQNLVR